MKQTTEIDFLENKTVILLRQCIDSIMSIEKTLQEINKLRKEYELNTVFGPQQKNNGKETTMSSRAGQF